MTAHARFTVLAVVAACVSLAGPGGAIAAPLPEWVAPSVIPNYFLILPDVATAGQPPAEGLRQLGELGFRVVVDLREPAEGIAEERTVVEAAGLRYVSVPITPATLSREKVAEVARILDEKDRGPVLLHCATANRVGGVWTVLQVTRGMSYDEAELEGRRIGLHSEAMIAAVKRVLRKDPPIH